MPAKENRKIMRHGTSGVIAIPKPHRDYHNLARKHRNRTLRLTLLIIPKTHENLLHEKAELIDKLLGQKLTEEIQ